MYDIIENFIPTTNISRKFKHPWMSRSLNKIKRLKEKRWNQYLRNKNIVTRHAFESAAMLYTDKFKAAKRNYERNLFQNKTTNQKKFFKYIKTCSSIQSVIPTLKVSENTVCNIANEQEKAEAFNNYFSSVFISDNGILPPGNPPVLTSTASAFKCTQTEVALALKDFKTDSSGGPDNFEVYFIKNISACITKPLHKLFSVSLETGKIPKEWKIAKITPVHEKGSKHTISNYRPISLTSVFSKCLEKIVRIQILKHLNNNNLIPTAQHGFLPGRSRVSNLLNCVNDWSLAMDRANVTDVIYLDFSKCFDSVSHPKLLSKLQNIGFVDMALDWLRDFLREREQFVALGTNTNVFKNFHTNIFENVLHRSDIGISDKKYVTSGVPQGTVLCPVLFLCYTCNLPSVVRFCKISIYADDTKLYNEICSFEDCENLQKDLDAVSDWACKWQLKLNPTKTCFLRIGYQNNFSTDYCIENKVIEKSATVCDLGVRMDCKLTFSNHCSHVTQRAFHTLYNLFKTFRNHDISFYLFLYTTYVRPILDSACEVWSPRNISDMDKMERVQKHFSKPFFTWS